ncbi:MAG: hypothetical protein ABI120_07215 [Gemmatimonadaceae bacterium]
MNFPAACGVRSGALAQTPLHRLIQRTRAAITAVLLGVASFMVAHSTASAQNAKNEFEFTRQGLLIVNFTPGGGADSKLGKRAADAVRSRVEKLVNKKEVEIYDGSVLSERMDHAGYGLDVVYSVGDIRALGSTMRADEFLLATVSNGPKGIKLSGELVLFRDERLRQPIVEAQNVRLDSAATLFANSFAAALSQLLWQRRCENGLRENSVPRAITAARQGIAAYPKSTIARTCLLWAMRQSGAPARDVLSVAHEVLAVDSTSYHALESAAIALDTLKRPYEAATMYLRLAATDTANLDLAARVIYSMVAGQNTKRAEPFVVSLAAAHPEVLAFTQQKWRITYDNRSWSTAIEAAEDLIVRDPVARGDSTFYLKLGTAYRSVNRNYDEIRTLAHAAKLFPGDVRIFSLYAQSIKMESDSVLPRGLSRFPASAELLAMNGKDLRARGKIAESLDATKRAMEIDSTMAQGRLVVAQLELELGRPDSALATLRRAVAGGEDSSLVAQFTLGKGNTFYRAAIGTMLMDDLALAYRFLTFADTLRPSVQVKFLIGATAFGIAQLALTESLKVKDKVELCRLVRLGADMIAVANVGLAQGVETFGEQATQSLYYLSQLEPYATQQKAQCGPG